MRARIAIADDGAGVSRWEVLVDGKPVAGESGADLQASCQEPFVDPVPCPTAQDLSLPLETAELRDGEHDLQAFALDAAGNAAWSDSVVFSTRRGALVTPPPVAEPTPDPASGVVQPPAVSDAPLDPVTSASATPFRHLRLRAWFSGKSLAILRTLRYGEATVVEGTLIDVAGGPVVGAAIGVRQRSIGTASRSQPEALARTDASGRFAYRLPPGPSRVIEVSYRAADSDAVPAATSRLTVRVRAGVMLRTSTARVRNGTALRFSGRVRGEVGTRRALVTIYALGGGPRKRIPVETVRAGSDGRFSYTHRFSRISGPSVYRFEARVPRQTGFPYLEGASRVVTVRGRP
jgi:hypothetical protein